MDISENNLTEIESDDLKLSFSELWESLKKISDSYQDLSKQYLDVRNKNESYEMKFSNEMEAAKDYENRILILEQKNFELNDVINSLNRKGEEFSSELIELKKFRNDYQLLSANFDDLIAQNERYKHDLSVFEEIESKFNNELELNKTLTQLNDEYLNQLGKLENENIDFSFAQKEIIRKNHELNEKNDELNKLKTRIAELESTELENKALKADRNHLITKVEETESRMSSIASTSDKFNEILDRERNEYNALIGELTNDLNNLKEITDVQEKTIDEYSGQNLNLRLEISGYEKKIISLDEIVKKSIFEIESLAKDRDDLNNKYTDYDLMKSEIFNLQSIIDEEKSNYSELEVKFQTLENSLFDYIERINLLNSEIANRNSEIHRINEEKNENSIFNIDWNERIEDLTKVIKNLKHQLNDTEKDLTAAKQEIIELKATYPNDTTKNDELNEKIYSLEKEIELRNSEIILLKEIVSQYEQESSQNESLILNSINKADDIADELKLSNLNNEVTLSKYLDLQLRYDELNSKYLEDHSKVINNFITSNNLENEIVGKQLDNELLKKEILNLSNQLQSKENEINELFRVLNESKEHDRTGELSEEILNMESYISKKDEEIDLLKNRILELNLKIEEKNNDLKVYEELSTRLLANETLLTESEFNLNSAKNEIEEINSLSPSNVIRIEDLNNKIYQLEQIIQMKNQELESTKESLSQYHEESSQNESLILNSINKADDITEELKIVKLRLEESLTKYQELINQNEELNIKYLEDHSKVIANFLEKNHFENQIAALQIEIESLKADIFSYAIQLQSKENEINDLFRVINEVKKIDRTSELSEEIINMESYIAKKDEEIDKLILALKDSTKDDIILRLNEKIDSLNSSLETKKAEFYDYEQLKINLKNAESIISNLEYKKESLEGELLIKNTEISVLEDKIEIIKRSDRTEEKSLSIQNLEAYSDEIQLELRIAKDERDSLKNQIDWLKENNFKNEELKAELIEQIKDKEDKIIEQSKEIYFINNKLNNEIESRKKISELIDFKIIELENIYNSKD